MTTVIHKIGDFMYDWLVIALIIAIACFICFYDFPKGDD